MPGPVDLSCVVHCHSTYSDGTGTVPQIAAAAAAAGVDVVLLTDHDSLEARRRGEERWHGETLVCVGEEVSPRGGNHYLAFGIDEEVNGRGLSARQVVKAVGAAGGFGFLAHPFSQGSERFPKLGKPMPWHDLEAPGFAGIEVWSLLTDTAERLASVREVARLIARPLPFLAEPPRRNLEAWDRLCAVRPVVGIAGVDAHQLGLRVGGRVPLRLYSYRRSFSFLRTHVLLDEPTTGNGAGDRDAVYAALRSGRCYMAVDALAPARGFRYTATGAFMGGEVAAGAELSVSVPRPATISILRDGATVATRSGTELRHHAAEPGVWRVEVTLPDASGRERAWILSNPIYVR